MPAEETLEGATGELFRFDDVVFLSVCENSLCARVRSVQLSERLLQFNKMST